MKDVSKTFSPRFKCSSSCVWPVLIACCFGLIDSFVDDWRTRFVFFYTTTSDNDFIGGNDKWWVYKCTGGDKYTWTYECTRNNSYSW